LRGISNLIAILMVIALVIGIGVAVGIILPKFMHSNAPKKGTLTLSGSDATYESSTRALWISIRGYYQGAEFVTLRKISVFYTRTPTSGSVCNVCVSLPGALCGSAPGCSVVNDQGGCTYVCSLSSTCPSGTIMAGLIPCSSISDVTVVPVTPLSNIGALNPNTYFKIVARSTGTLTSAPSKIVVAVEYCYPDNTCAVATEQVSVKIT
jgi:hypothetical protein